MKDRISDEAEGRGTINDTRDTGVRAPRLVAEVCSVAHTPGDRRMDQRRKLGLEDRIRGVPDLSPQAAQEVLPAPSHLPAPSADVPR